MQFDREKLKTVVLYICSRLEPSQLSAVKLHKALYFADMIHYALNGAPITGAVYRKRQFGPTCDALLVVLRDLEQDNALKVREVDYFGYRKKEFEALASPDMERLTAVEAGLIDEVIDFVCRQNTARTISEFSYAIPWETAEFGEVLPYHSAIHLFPTQASLETLEWGAGEAAAIEAQRSNEDPMGLPDFAAFRKRVLEGGAQSDELWDLLLSFDDIVCVNPRRIGEPHPAFVGGKVWIYKSPPISRLPRVRILYEIDDESGIVIYRNFWAG